MKIYRRFTFEAAHYLPGHGKCGRMHGHSYKVVVAIGGTLNTEGMIIDFGELKKLVNQHAIDKLDHTLLNEVINIRPTVENLAIWIWKQLAFLLKRSNINDVVIKVWETENCAATYWGEEL